MNTYQIWLGEVHVTTVKGDGLSHDINNKGNQIYKTITFEDGAMKGEIIIAWFPDCYAIIQIKDDK